MKSLIQSYIKEEDAIDDSIMKILFFVGAIAIGGAVVYFAYNMLSGQASKATDKIDNLSNPGSGNEFQSNPLQN